MIRRPTVWSGYYCQPLLLLLLVANNVTDSFWFRNTAVTFRSSLHATRSFAKAKDAATTVTVSTRNSTHTSNGIVSTNLQKHSMNPDGWRYLRERLKLTPAQSQKLSTKDFFCPDPMHIALMLNQLQSPPLSITRNATLTKLILRSPAIIGLNYTNTISPTLNSLRHLLNITDIEDDGTVTALSKLVMKYPTILTLNYERNLRPTCASLQKHLQLSPLELQRMLKKHPVLMGLSYPANLRPTLLYLQQRLNLSTTELRRIILKQPSILDLNIDSNLSPTLSAVTNELHLAANETRRMVIRNPSILTLSFDANIQPTLHNFQDHLCLSHGELKRLVVCQPSLLSLNFETNVKPKLEWLSKTFKLNTTHLKFLLLKESVMLSSSLEKALIPNVEFYKTHCFPQFSNDPTGESLALAHMIRQPRQLTISHARLLNRTHMFKEVGIPLECLWGKAAFTDEKLEEWMKQVGVWNGDANTTSTTNTATPHTHLETLQELSNQFRDLDIPLQYLWDKTKYSPVELHQWMDDYVARKNSRSEASSKTVQEDEPVTV